MTEPVRGRPLIAALSDDELFSEADFLKDADIDPSNLQSAIVKHSGQYYRYGKLHAVAMRLEEEAKLAVETRKSEVALVAAELETLYREQTASSARRTTDGAIRALVIADMKYMGVADALRDAETALSEAKFTKNILSLAEKVFARRSDLLQTLGYMDYAERNSNVEVSRKEFNEMERTRQRREIERVVATSRGRESKSTPARRTKPIQSKRRHTS